MLLSVIGMLTIDGDALGVDAEDADALGLVLGVIPPALLAIRRRHPVFTLWVSAAIIIPFWVIGYPDATTSLALLVHSYTVAAHVERPTSIVHALATGTVLIGVMIVGVFAEDTDLPPIAVVGNVIVFATAWLLGDSLRNRRAYLAEGDPGALPPGVGITVFRVVQESLTNVVKHAGPARADVHLEIGAEHVDVQVVDDGRGPAARDGGSGQGHIGMRERVETFGGDLDVSPRPGGGFRVRARVPFGARP